MRPARKLAFAHRRSRMASNESRPATKPMKGLYVLVTDGKRCIVVEDAEVGGLMLPCHRQWPIGRKPLRNQWPAALLSHVLFGSTAAEQVSYTRPRGQRPFGMPEDHTWALCSWSPAQLDSAVDAALAARRWWHSHGHAKAPWTLKLADLDKAEKQCSMASAACIKAFVADLGGHQVPQPGPSGPAFESHPDPEALVKPLGGGAAHEQK